MTSPAERYTRARERAAHPALAEFTAGYTFDLDPFQTEAARALEDGQAVLVCAPTGAGKTVVGEFAVHLALAQGRKCFYTTPIKALSNQKYADLSAWHGPDKVGLLTGDNAVNGDAPIVVMTTEVLRNMLYAGSPALSGLGYVVMDEVHYLADRFRGAVWEEVIIHLPRSVTLVSLSATVSNAEEFADWLLTVRGRTKVIVSEDRPVPLWQHMMVGNRIYDLFRDTDPDTGQAGARAHEVNPDLVARIRQRTQGGHDRYRDRRRPDRAGHVRPPSRADVIARLDSAGLLPAITFIFSRAGCDAAVDQCLRAGVRLTTEDERAEVTRIASERVADIPSDDLRVLGYWEWLDGLERGVAAHHAGMVPTFKELVEELFVRGLVKAVFATETLALGINMPARSVVLERLVKWNGEQHADITPGEYTQLTGRAGRRGIDVEGHGVVLWSPQVDPARVAGLASTRTYPLRSSFRPSYNMAVNLVGQMGRDRARKLLASSFAQFQADRAVVGLVRQIERNTEALDGYRRAMTCHLGDFAEYADLRVRLKNRENERARLGAARRRAQAAESLRDLRVGDVIQVTSGRRAGMAVVLDPGIDPLNEPRPLVLTEDRWAGRLSLTDFPRPVRPLTRLTVPKRFNHRSPKERRDLASTLRNARAGLVEPGPTRRRSDPDDEEITRLRAALRAHPCHGCADREDHARWAERHDRLRRDTDGLRRRVENRTHSVPRTFDRVCALLDERGYLDGDTVTPDGRRLARIWSESDLLVAECLRTGVWDGLSGPELAACAAAVLYESRRDDAVAPPAPNTAIRTAVEQMTRLWSELEEDETEHRLELTRGLDAGFAWPAYRWAKGESLDRVLAASDAAGQELSPGDFVRWCKQVLDLLDQIDKVSEPDSPVRTRARAAITAMRRGVVAYSSVG